MAVEATVMRYVGERGFPVPKVLAAGQADLVMKRVEGPTRPAAPGSAWTRPR